MIKTLDRFELVELIESGGFTTVYRAIEHMGQGITRPAAVKVMASLGQDDEEQVDRLRREVEVLIKFGGAPNIVSILGMGIDDEMGAWIAMELAGKSLKHFIGDRPAEPDQARVLLRDALRALTIVHGADSFLLHRDIKPENILSSRGVWKVADFGLAKQRGEEDTMPLATVKYAAPELLDGSLGEESARIDLYSLGLVAYEYALGRKLFRKQFPSIYDPSGAESKGGDDRPKWMYWHTSQQMVLPPLEEVIEGYPKDLSDLVASMIAKPVEQRVVSAEEALRRLGEVSAHAPSLEQAEEVKVRERSSSIGPKLAVAATLAVVVAMVGGLMWFLLQGRTRVEFDPSLPSVVASEQLEVKGRLKNYDGLGKVDVKLLGKKKSFEIDILPGGEFSSVVELPTLGGHSILVSVKDVAGKQIAAGTLELEREMPERVRVVFSTRPVPVPDVTIMVRSDGGDGPLETAKTDAGGQASFEVPFGEFSLEAVHARFLPVLVGVRTTGASSTCAQDLFLVPRDYAEVQAQMTSEMDRLVLLMRYKVNCPPGPLSALQEQEVIASTAKVRELGGGDSGVEIWLETIAQVKDCDPTTMVSAPPPPPAAGVLTGGFVDPAVEQNRLIKGIDDLLKIKTECPPGPLSAKAEELLVGSLDDLEALAMGDISVTAYVESARQAKDCDPASRPTELPRVETLEEKSDPAVAMNRLRDRVMDLLKRKTECPPGPLSGLEEEILLSTLSELSALSGGDIGFRLFIDRAQRAKDCDPSSLPEDIPHKQTRAEREEILRKQFPGMSDAQVQRMLDGDSARGGRSATLAEREAELRRRNPDKSPEEIREMAKAQMVAEAAAALARKETELREKYPNLSSAEIREMAKAELAQEAASSRTKTVAEVEAELRRRYPDKTSEEIRQMAKAEMAMEAAGYGPGGSKSSSDSPEVAEAINRLIKRIEGLVDTKVQCPPGPLSEFEERTLADSQAELRALAAGDVDIQLYLDGLQRVKDCDPSSRPQKVQSKKPGQDQTDPNVAINMLQDRIEGLLDRKVECPPGPLSAFEETALGEALTDLGSLAPGDVDIQLYIDKVSRVMDCDPSSRPEKLQRRETRKERDERVAKAYQASGSGAGTNQTLAQRESSLRKQFPNATDSEIRQMAREQQRADAAHSSGLAGSTAQNKTLEDYKEELRKKYPDLTEAQIEQMAAIQKMTDETSSAMTSLGGGRAGSSGSSNQRAPSGQTNQRAPSGQSLGTGGAVDSTIAETLAGLPANQALVNRLMAMPLDQFLTLVRQEVPMGAVEVKALPSLDQVRIQGPLFNHDELSRLVVRLAYGMGRIQTELEVDPWGVGRKVERGLAALGAAGVQVDAYTSRADPTLFVQFKKGSGVEPGEAELFSRSFVLDPGLLWVADYLDMPEESKDEVEGE